LEEALGLDVDRDDDRPAAVEIEQLQAIVQERDQELAAREQELTARDDAFREKEELVQDQERRIKSLVLELTETRIALSSARQATAVAMEASGLAGGSDMHLPSTLCDSRSGGHSRSDADMGRDADGPDPIDGILTSEEVDRMASRVDELQRALEDASLELTAAQQVAQRKEQWLHNSVRANCEMQRKYFHLKVKLQSVHASGSPVGGRVVKQQVLSAATSKSNDVADLEPVVGSDVRFPV
jgi:hypothetical protein